MRDVDNLKLLIQSRVPLIFIRSRDEERALHLITRTALALEQPVYRWTATDGLSRAETGGPAGQRLNIEPQAVLNHIRTATERGLYVLLDFHPYLEHPGHRRALKDVALDYAKTARTVILLSSEITVPDELKALSAQYELQLPSAEELRALVQQVANEWSHENARRRVRTDPQSLELLIRNLAGLTVADAKRLARLAIVNDGAITATDVTRIMQAKHQLLDQSGALGFEHDAASLDEIAGMPRLKQWLAVRRRVFHDPAAHTKLEPPKGILLLGVQGCGKSLAAKAAAAVFGVPLLRLDLGTLYNKYHGETERNLREALKTAEALAPCVLWIDELEKGLATSDSDDGVSRRVLGTLLTWMAERRGGVFIAATANAIDQLPPELLRKGRFDEIFFVDLPDPAARADIFAIHLRERELDPAQFDLPALAQTADGFSGAEIEQAVVAALYSAHARNERLRDTHLVQELRATRPLSVVMAEQVGALRAWAAGRTVAA
jgi:SpoVK/Ycf46/Vps4 family AAA+-type ATPase